MVLCSFLASPSDHPRFSLLVQSWPPHIFSLATVTDAAEQRARALDKLSQRSQALYEALSELHRKSGNPERALFWGMRGMEAAGGAEDREGKAVELFGYVDAHSLFPVVLEHVSGCSDAC